MSSYQIPQFLDSGDKILGPLNLRQFGYALGGFLLGVMIFTVVNSIFPTLGVLAWVPSVPVVLLFTYLALGKFNGRDSDVYVYKFFFFVIKPKIMKYQRHPYLDDLNKKMSDWTVEKINKRWESSLAQTKQIAGNEYLTFNQGNSDDKASKIKRLGNSLDDTLLNSTIQVESKLLSIRAKEAMFRNYQSANQKLTKRGLTGKTKLVRPLGQVPVPPPIARPAVDNNAQNFFNAQKLTN
jgi:hypothetical protein